MNVQHLESLNDIVSGITGIRVWETVPDRVFDDADEVVVVDLPPDELLQRLKEGKVYLPQQAERAAANFFRKGNLLALRELALRRTADRVDDEMRAYRRRSATQPVWPNREALLACIGPGDRRREGRAQQRPPGRPARRALARGARRDAGLQRRRGATPAARCACCKLAAGARCEHRHAWPRPTRRRRWCAMRASTTWCAWWSGAQRTRRWPWQRTLADRIAAQADDLDVMQVALPTATPRGAQKPTAPHAPTRPAGIVAGLRWPRCWSAP